MSTILENFRIDEAHEKVKITSSQVNAGHEEGIDNAWVLGSKFIVLIHDGLTFTEIRYVRPGNPPAKGSFSIDVVPISLLAGGEFTIHHKSVTNGEDVFTRVVRKPDLCLPESAA